MAKPWLTSDDLIASVKRKIAVPISQVTFTEDDILAFANEEMAISQVPSVMSYHEEYFVTEINVDLEPNKSRYPIPERAIGMKLRDLFWKDASGNLFEMARISSEDKAFFQRNVGAGQAMHKYYLEGNDIVLAPQVTDNPTGSLAFFYFLRPNQLVTNDQAAISKYFTKTITVDNTNIVAGDKLTIDGIDFTAVAGAPGVNEFQIGGSSIITATNLTSSINTHGIVIANNGSPSTAIVTLKYTVLSIEIDTSNSLSLTIQNTQGVEFQSIPDNITNGTIIDFLQTKPGHRTVAMDITLGNNAISGTTITFNSGIIPDTFVVGDYICLAHDCIIPQIPSDLHHVLTERTAARILSALGDLAGLQTVNQKIAEMEVRQGTLIDSRVDGSNAKVTNRHSHLRYNKMNTRRRL